MRKELSSCIRHFSMAVKTTTTKGNLWKKEFILIADSRGIRVHRWEDNCKMKTALILLSILGMACAFSMKNFHRRVKAEDSEENGVFKYRPRYFLYKHAYFYPSLKRFPVQETSNEEENNEDSEGNEDEETEAENTTLSSVTAVYGTETATGTETIGLAALQLPKKAGDAGSKAAKKKESDEEEEEEEENENEEAEVDESEQVVNGTSTNSTEVDGGNGSSGGDNGEEGDGQSVTEAGAEGTTLGREQISDGSKTADLLNGFQHTTPPLEAYGTTPPPFRKTTTAEYGGEYEQMGNNEDNGEYQVYDNENGEPRGDNYRAYEDEYSYYKGRGYEGYDGVSLERSLFIDLDSRVWTLIVLVEQMLDEEDNTSQRSARGDLTASMYPEPTGDTGGESVGDALLNWPDQERRGAALIRSITQPIKRPVTGMELWRDKNKEKESTSVPSMIPADVNDTNDHFKDEKNQLRSLPSWNSSVKSKHTHQVRRSTHYLTHLPPVRKIPSNFEGSSSPYTQVRGDNDVPPFSGDGQHFIDIPGKGGAVGPGLDSSTSHTGLSGSDKAEIVNPHISGLGSNEIPERERDGGDAIARGKTSQRAGAAGVSLVEGSNDIIGSTNFRELPGKEGNRIDAGSQNAHQGRVEFHYPRVPSKEKLKGGSSDNTGSASYNDIPKRKDSSRKGPEDSYRNQVNLSEKQRFPGDDTLIFIPSDVWSSDKRSRRRALAFCCQFLKHPPLIQFAGGLLQPTRKEMIRKNNKPFAYLQSM
ncbi:hypothetical protein STEG23_003163 [Scotinomys teguina]